MTNKKRNFASALAVSCLFIFGYSGEASAQSSTACSSRYQQVWEMPVRASDVGQSLDAVLRRPEFSAERMGSLGGMSIGRAPDGTVSLQVATGPGRASKDRVDSFFLSQFGGLGVDAACLSVEVFLPTGFQWPKSGSAEMPIGLWGGEEAEDLSDRTHPDAQKDWMVRTRSDRSAMRGYSYNLDRAGNAGAPSKDSGPSWGGKDWGTGKWHVIEMEVVMNTPGRADGYYKYWLNGRRFASETNLQFRRERTWAIRGLIASSIWEGDSLRKQTQFYANHKLYILPATQLAAASVPQASSFSEGAAVTGSPLALTASSGIRDNRDSSTGNFARVATTQGNFLLAPPPAREIEAEPAIPVDIDATDDSGEPLATNPAGAAVGSSPSTSKSDRSEPFLNEDSPWNTPLPSSPVVAANSGAIIAKMASWRGPAKPAANVFDTTADFDIPVYYAAETDPWFELDLKSLDDRELQISGMKIRIPDTAQPSGGSDAHFVVVDEKREWAYEFWGVSSKSAGRGALVATAGGRFRWHGDGFDNANALASKTAAVAGLVTAAELQSGSIEHAIAIVGKSSDGTAVWPASGLAGTRDPQNAPPNGTWLQYNRTFAQIDADATRNGWHTTEVMILKAMSKYGAVVVDTGGASWNIRFLGDASTASLGGGEPMADYAASASGWSGSTIRYMTWSPTIDWANHLRVLNATALKGAYDARLASRKLDPISTVFSNWTVTGASTTSRALTDPAYPPFRPGSAVRIGTNVPSEIAEVRVEDLTVPQGENLAALTLWYYGNTAPGSTYRVSLLHATTQLATYTQPPGQNYGWRSLSYGGAMHGVDLADIRMKFEYLNGTNFSSIRSAFVVAEFENAR